MVSVAERYLSNNLRDAMDKMRACIVFCEGDWWHINGYVDPGSWNAECSSVQMNKGKPRETKVFNLSKIDASNFSAGPYDLGMVNYEGFKGVGFMSRRPVRRNKFGLREENCDISHIAGDQSDNRVIRPFNSVWHSGSLYRTLQGDYPTYEIALAMLRKGSVWAVAFSRSFALERVGLKTLCLKYRTAAVGEVSITTGEVELYPSYGHMKQRVEAIKGCPKVSVVENF